MTLPLIDHPAILILDAPAASGVTELDALAADGIDGQILEYRAEDPAAPESRQALARADFILTRRTDVDEAMLRQAGRCLMVAFYGPGCGPGVGRVAMETARELGIYVASVPDYAATEWAERTFQGIESLRVNFAFKNKRYGVMGLGAVGRLVARRARALGARVWACDPFVGDEFLAQEGAERADLATLMGIADILSLHVPLGPSTGRLISAELLQLMKKEALLINPSAAELVDFAGLNDAFARGRPAAAFFDEDLALLLPPSHPLLRQKGLVQGPRQAGTGPDAALACRRAVGGLLFRVLQGQRPDHLLIDPPCPRHILLMASTKIKARR